MKEESEDDESDDEGKEKEKDEGTEVRWKEHHMRLRHKWAVAMGIEEEIAQEGVQERMNRKGETNRKRDEDETEREGENEYAIVLRQPSPIIDESNESRDVEQNDSQSSKQQRRMSKKLNDEQQYEVSSVSEMRCKLRSQTRLRAPEGKQKRKSVKAALELFQKLNAPRIVRKKPSIQDPTWDDDSLTGEGKKKKGKK